MSGPACAHLPKSVFFPIGRSVGGRAGRQPPDYRVARAVCNACPVKADCLDRAIERDEEYGMWGGLTPGERRALRRTA